MAEGSRDLQLRQQLSQCLDRFLAARDSGHEATFQVEWLSLSAEVEHALDADELSPATVRAACAAASAIKTLAAGFVNLDTQESSLRNELGSKIESCIDEYDVPSTCSKGTELPFAWVEPLLQFLLDNVALPYPDPDEKQRLLDDVYAAGWEEISPKKLDDYLGMMRARMGYTLLLKNSAIDEDRDLLQDVVCRVLSDTPSEVLDLPDTLVHAVQDMHQFVVDQLDTKAAKEQTSPWARGILGLVQDVSAREPEAESAPIYDGTDSFCSDDDTQYSDGSSDFSDTDVEDLVDEPIRGIIGTKRKYSGLQGLGFPTSSPLSRSSSSSSLSSRGSSIWSRRSSSGSSSASSVDWEEEQREGNDRPTKRRRSSVELPSYDLSSPAASSLEDKPSQPSPVDASLSDSLLHETTSPCSSSSSPSAQSPEPIPFSSSALFPAESPAVMAAGSMQKRKRAASDDEDARPVVSKRRRHSASPPSIPMQHFGALGIIGHLPWDGPSCASSAVELELEAYALDSSPFAHGVAPEPLDDADEEVEKEDDEEENDVYDRLVDYSNECMLEEVVEDGTPGTFTWSEMQLHVLDSILSYGARPTPAATATRNIPLSSPQGFRLDLPSLDDDDLAYLLNIAAGPSMPPPAEMISPPLPSMDSQTFDLDADVKPLLPESDADDFVRMLQGWTSASVACPIRLEEPAPFADAEVDKCAVDFLSRAPADLMTH